MVKASQPDEADDPGAGDGHDLGLDQFEAVTDDQGISLDQLSQAYAQLLGKGDDPYEPPAEPREVEVVEVIAQAEATPQDDACELCPRSIVEAILFVGHPKNEPMTAQQIAALMRGVPDREIDELISELNQSYLAHGHPYHVASVDTGYRLELREEFWSMRNVFYGRVREARLSQAAVLPMFIGIAIGVLIGSLPLRVPGSAITFRIGLAGGPLIAAIVLSRIGTLGPLVWHIPPSANHMLRTIGISLFLGAVGVRAGAGFLETFLGGGVSWLLGGVLITLIPVLLASFAARVVFKIDFMSLCGLIAGSTTNPPALAYAHSLAPKSDEISMAFVTVYPLTMLLRLFVAQALVLFFS